MGLLEKPEPYLPLLVDVDLKSDKDENLYTQEIVKEVIITYQKVLKNVLKEYNEKTLICVLLEKE